MHASFYCDYVIGVENDSLSYLVAAGMLGYFKSSRIVIINSNFTKIPLNFQWKNVVVVYDNSVGWTPEDRSFTRNFVDLSNNVKVVVTNFRFPSDPMNLENPSKNGALWMLFKVVNGTKLSGGNNENLTMKVFVRISERKTAKKNSNRQGNNLFVTAFKLFDQNLVYHFLNHENNQFMLLGEDGFLSSCRYWERRAELYMSKFESIRHGCGRIVQNANNCCYANSFLAIFCNIPIIRNAINTSLGNILPSRCQIDEDETGVTALVYILMVYSKSHSWPKTPLLLPYKRRYFSSKNDYFDFGAAMNKILIKRNNKFLCEDQDEWLKTIFFPLVNKLPNTDSSLLQLFGFSETKCISTKCGYKSNTPLVHLIPSFGITFFGEEQELKTVSMQDLISSYTASEKLPDFTKHFIPFLQGRRNPSILTDHLSPYDIFHVENPACNVGDVVFEKRTGKLGTITSTMDNKVNLRIHVLAYVCNILLFDVCNILLFSRVTQWTPGTFLGGNFPIRIVVVKLQRRSILFSINPSSSFLWRIIPTLIHFQIRKL